MLATPHILVGATIASTNLDPSISLPICFLSHFILDAIPHLESSTFLAKYRSKEDELSQKEITYAILDCVLGAIIVLFLYLKFNNIMLVYGAFFALLPDIIDNVPYWYGIRKLPVFKQLHQLHDFVHHNLSEKYWYIGLATQLALFGCVAWVFMR
ncbi:MAG: hypothetical protein NT135_02150 [Candidatus Berkelbacteria bacterium]|nr:hypothetical protein [Candidatus Berkelbacteria bacterium]